MSVRRERPPIDIAGGSIRLRLPDGSVKEMPVDRRPGSEACCFCGEDIDGGELRLSAEWIEEGEERAQSWRAHASCLTERLHESAAGLFRNG